MKEERQAPSGKGRPMALKTFQAKATPIGDIEVIGEDRRLTNIGEFDRVLGGGVIPGAVVLIGGDPGIGKTTLLLQALPRLASHTEPVLYVSGEESPRQIKMRGQRNHFTAQGRTSCERCSTSTRRRRRPWQARPPKWWQ